MDQNYNNQPQQTPSKGMAVASMVLGIIALVLSCFWYISVPCAVVGLILGILGRKKCEAAKGMATAGMVMSIIAIVLVILFITVLAGIIASIGLSA
ncbi:DUF4190 domain-containing protein [Massiliimalia massiliensis]|uniref:DUF4190 domain-containing protein n=1 Tax=Massiliimalia massiliensis TaxID=1852384 RepID=UPI001E43C8C0|nr:DUF4190 domain-containing protein [Massiliimalia massiliensis]